MSPTSLAGATLTKGHGTENDFLLVHDPDGALDVDAATVARLCDRRAGVGADGLIRVVRSAALTEGHAALEDDPAAEWFMDYRNADGSVAEMCGNGVRVFVEYLRRRGLAEVPEGAVVVVGTRGGTREVTYAGGLYTVDMGRWVFPGGEAALDQGFDVAVQVAGLAGQRAGLRVAVPNPHTVVALPDVAELSAAELTGQVDYDPVPPEGTNLELVVPLGEVDVSGARVGTVRMRVLERGVGETRSCGTGTCAAALAVRAWAGAGSPDVWRVLVPGGEVTVRVDRDRVLLTGPAELVADVVPLSSPGAR